MLITSDCYHARMDSTSPVGHISVSGDSIALTTSTGRGQYTKTYPSVIAALADLKRLGLFDVAERLEYISSERENTHIQFSIRLLPRSDFSRLLEEGFTHDEFSQE
jgi:hypothetical protein